MSNKSEKLLGKREWILLILISGLILAALGGSGLFIWLISSV